MPGGDWFDLYTGKVLEGNQEIIVESPIHKLPVFIKAGSVLPMQQAMPHTGIKQDEWILHIYCGRESSEFLYYTDDGSTFDYQDGKSIKRLIQYYATDNKVVVSPEEGHHQTSFKTMKVVLHGSTSEEVTIHGTRQKLTSQLHSFFAPLQKYDPIKEPDSMGEENVKVITSVYSVSQIEITW